MYQVNNGHSNDYTLAVYLLQRKLFTLVNSVKTSVADPDPVRSGLFGSPGSGSGLLAHKQTPSILIFS